MTPSAWNHIDLNSQSVVSDECNRKMTPVHELFHRVQYSYGYESGAPNMQWVVEATASWAQKLCALDVGDCYEPGAPQPRSETHDQLRGGRLCL